MSGEFQESIALEAEKAERRDKLNRLFSEGESAWTKKAVEIMAKAEFPIVLDFNNVLVSNNEPLEINPEARTFLQKLAAIGEIFVVTTSSIQNRAGVLDLLKNLCPNNDIVLIQRENYYRNIDSKKEEAKKIEEEYLELIDSQNLRAELEIPADLKTNPSPSAAPAFGMRPDTKQLAPCFKKSWRIPVIDDCPMATVRNPGSVGFLVPIFEPHPRDNYEETRILNSQTERLSLEKVFKQIKEYKESLQAAGKI
jgi:hypothetical protein